MKNLILLFVVLLHSCTDEHKYECFNMDTGASFYVLDSEGKDLLNPNHPNAINVGDIRMFDLIDGVKKDVSRNIFLEKPGKEYDKYRLGLALKDTPTIIKWNKHDSDTLKAEIERGDCYVISTKIWVNDKLVWSAKDGRSRGRFFILKK